MSLISLQSTTAVFFLKPPPAPRATRCVPREMCGVCVCVCECECGLFHFLLLTSWSATSRSIINRLRSYIDRPSPVSSHLQKPHVLFVLWDDYGWTGAGYHRQPNTTAGIQEIRTPTLDTLVKAGIEFDRHYVFYCCSPTRSSIQSGRNPIHVNVLNVDPDVCIQHESHHALKRTHENSGRKTF